MHRIKRLLLGNVYAVYLASLPIYLSKNKYVLFKKKIKETEVMKSSVKFWNVEDKWTLVISLNKSDKFNFKSSLDANFKNEAIYCFEPIGRLVFEPSFVRSKFFYLALGV